MMIIMIVIVSASQAILPCSAFYLDGMLLGSAFPSADGSGRDAHCGKYINQTTVVKKMSGTQITWMATFHLLL